MGAIQKEKIYIELRKYHLEEFPANMSTENMGKKLKEFRDIEDNIINMLLGLVNGKTVFTDFSNELKSFRKKVKVTPTSDRLEDADRNMFNSKAERLSEIMQIAEEIGFELKTRKGFR